MGPSWRCVVVELVLLRLDPDSPTRIAYRTIGEDLLRNESPDNAAARLAGLRMNDTDSVPAANPPPVVRVLHSTSWRHDPSGVVTLTYAALPDPCVDLPADPLVAPAVVCSGDPLRPRPDELHSHHVAAHAVRHLAYLVDRDPGIARATRDDAQAALWQALAEAAARMPTGTHSAAHSAAQDADDASAVA